MSGSVFLSGGGEVGGPVGNVVTGYTSGRSVAGIPATSDCWVAMFFRITSNASPDYRILFQMTNLGGSVDGHELGLSADGLSLSYFSPVSGGTPSIPGDAITLGQWYFASFCVFNTTAYLWWKRVGQPNLRKGIHAPVSPYTPDAFTVGTEFETDNSHQFGVTGNVVGVRFWSGVLPSDEDVEMESRQVRARRRVDLYEEWPMQHPADTRGRIRGIVIGANNTATVAAGASPPAFDRAPRNPRVRGFATATDATANAVGATMSSRVGVGASQAAAIAAAAGVAMSKRAAVGTAVAGAVAASAGATMSARPGAAVPACQAFATAVGALLQVRAAEARGRGSSPAVSPGFDPASTEALILIARARTDDLSFDVLSVVTRRLLSGQGSGQPAAQHIAPRTLAMARYYYWTALYRQRGLAGAIVADVAYEAVARGILVRDAIAQMDAIDSRSPLPDLR